MYTLRLYSINDFVAGRFVLIVFTNIFHVSSHFIQMMGIWARIQLYRTFKWCEYVLTCMCVHTRIYVYVYVCVCVCVCACVFDWMYSHQSIHVITTVTEAKVQL